MKSITSGKTPEGIQYLQEDGVPFLGATNVLFYHVDIESAPRISQEIHNTTLKSSQIKRNNVLITMAGVGLGRCAVFESDLECNCNQAVAILEINDQKILPYYLMYYLNSEIGQLFIEKLQHQADQPNINLEEIKRILVVLPEKDEQERIVNKCTPIQNDLQKNQEFLEQLKNDYDKPMREALGKNPIDYKRVHHSNFYSIFPENLENKRERLDYVANHPLFDWIRVFREGTNVASLESIIDPNRFSYGLSESACESGSIGFLNVQHLSFEGRIVFDPKTYLKESSPKKLLKENDIIIARTGHTLGKAALITDEFAGFSFGSFCIRFSLNTDKYLPDFIAQYINSIYGQAQIMLLKAGSGKNNINQDHIRDIRIPVIDKTVQKSILAEYGKFLTNLLAVENQQKELTEKLTETFKQELFQL